LAVLADRDDDPEAARRARALQYEAAHNVAAEDFGDGMALFDQMIEAAPSESEAADAIRRKADAALEAGRFLYAQDEYRALVSLHPRSQWVPYCWFRIADCEWRMARWLGLGMEGVREAERSFSDFTDIYPLHPYADEAEQKAEAAREQLARMNAEVARFYVQAEERPWAAVPYLRRVVSRFPESSEAEWAAQQLRQIEGQLQAPLRGDLRSMSLPGVQPER
ncbi:MAG: outer membrane protein assembly factor BamD, partial [Candidatus Brocadiia bacterium]